MNFSVLHFDAIEEFYYDPRTQRYRWRGTSGGRFASKSAVLERTRRYVDEQRSQLTQHTLDLANNKITLVQWQQRSSETLKKIHISQAILGHDGLENMTSADWLRVGREVKRQTLGGIADDGRRYGIKHLARELQQGKVTEGELLARIQMFGNSGKVSHSEAFKAHNIGSLAVRVLGKSDRHCPFCVEQASKEPRPIEEVPTIGCCPQCLTSCRCTIEVVQP